MRGRTTPWDAKQDIERGKKTGLGGRLLGAALCWFHCRAFLVDVVQVVGCSGGSVHRAGRPGSPVGDRCESRPNHAATCSWVVCTRMLRATCSPLAVSVQAFGSPFACPSPVLASSPTRSRRASS